MKHVFLGVQVRNGIEVTIEINREVAQALVA